jgi:hypothetical protein
MIFVELAVQILESPMIGPVLPPALEPLLVGECMSFTNVAVESIVLLVVARVFVVVLVRERWRKGHRKKQQSAGCSCSSILAHHWISLFD